MPRANLTPLSWQGRRLVASQPLAEPDEGYRRLTVLHTNDFHSSIDGRPGADGQVLGGIARIATTICRARALGATLAVDSGDAAFGMGTWWDARGARATAELRGMAGYDLAAIGNHDLEMGVQGLVQLLDAGYELVCANLRFEDTFLSERIHPACIADVDGFRVGFAGVVTHETEQFVPKARLAGITLLPPDSAMDHVVAGLEPLVDTIAVLSHLGLDRTSFGDRELAQRLEGSKVSLILGGHTHEELDPPIVVAGTTLCNAGAYGRNVNQVTIERTDQGRIEISSRLVPQDEKVPEHFAVGAARDQRASTYRDLHDSLIPLPQQSPHGGGSGRALLLHALRDACLVDPQALVLMPDFYFHAPIPRKPVVSQADLFSTYPSADRLVEVEVDGADLRALLGLQKLLPRYAASEPLWLHNGLPAVLEELDRGQLYTFVTSELTAQGGLFWSSLPNAAWSVRPLGYSCLDLVLEFLVHRDRFGLYQSKAESRGPEHALHPTRHRIALRGHAAQLTI